jgi:hypothetical protein
MIIFRSKSYKPALNLWSIIFSLHTILLRLFTFKDEVLMQNIQLAHIVAPY